MVQLTGVAKPATAPACVCRLHTVAVRLYKLTTLTLTLRHYLAVSINCFW